MKKILKEVFIHFLNSNTFQEGASLAYYTIFSFVPIIIIFISLLGFFFGDQAVSGEIYTQLKGVFGNDASIQIQEIIKNHHTNHNSITTTIIGFVILIFSALGMFTQIHDSFNSIWNVNVKSKSSIIKYFSKYLVSLFLLISLFFIIFISTIISSLLITYSQNLHVDYNFLYIYEHFLSFAIMSIVFTIMFKFLGDAQLHWKVTFIGGLITSLLFIFGKVVIAWYIGYSHLSSTFGSAMFLVLLLLWIYYTSQILFLGASFVKVISSRFGYEIIADNDSVKIND